MKNLKFIVLMFLSLLISKTAFAQSIKVNDPHTGDIWYKSRSYIIKWTKSGSMNAKVKIRLYNTAGTVKILGITNNTENDGTFEWKIPGTVRSGNYRIRVKTLDNAVYDDSDIFLIKQANYTNPSYPSNFQKIPASRITLPDFYISSMAISPRSPVVFHSVKFNAVIKNTTAKITPVSTGELRVSRLSDVPGRGYAQRHLFKFNIPALQHNQTYTYKKAFIHYQSGRYRNELTIDKSNVVRNEIETNNTKTLKYIVQPLKLYFTPKNLVVLIKSTDSYWKKHWKDFKNLGPMVSFKAEVFISRDGKKLLINYLMRAYREPYGGQFGKASGEHVLYSLYQKNEGFISSFAGGYTKVNYGQYWFTFGKTKDGHKVPLDLWGTQLTAYGIPVGKGKTNPMKVIYFMGNNPRGKDDIGYCGFEIYFNKIEIVLDGKGYRL